MLALATAADLEPPGCSPRVSLPTRSQLERWMLALITQADLPRPRVSEPIGPDQVAFLWPRQGVVVEPDATAAAQRPNAIAPAGRGS